LRSHNGQIPGAKIHRRGAADAQETSEATNSAFSASLRRNFLFLGLKLQSEIDQALFVPIDFAEIKLRLDLADLIANPLRHHGGLRIVQDDAFFIIEPARPFVDFGDDGIQPQGQDFVLELPLLGIKDFSMPGKVTDEFGNVLRIGRSGRDNSGAFALAIRNIADGAIGEKRVKLSL
jgi:hypothetical protein